MRNSNCLSTGQQEEYLKKIQLLKILCILFSLEFTIRHRWMSFLWYVTHQNLSDVFDYVAIFSFKIVTTGSSIRLVNPKSWEEGFCFVLVVFADWATSGTDISLCKWECITPACVCFGNEISFGTLAYMVPHTCILIVITILSSCSFPFAEYNNFYLLAHSHLWNLEELPH